MTVELRPGRRSDAAEIARILDLASQGLLPHLWARAAEPGEDALAVGLRRIRGDEGGISWRNAVLAEVGGQVAGGLVTYALAASPDPLDDVPPILRPPQALKNRWALGTEYVLALAVLPEFRRRGVARALMAEAERRAAGQRALSLIVFSDNRPARALYADLGFVEREHAPMIKGDWACGSEAWILCVKPGGGTGGGQAG